MAAEDTHETDKELWLNAHHRAPSATLAPGVMLSDEDRQYAQDRVNEIADDNERERAQSRAGI